MKRLVIAEKPSVARDVAKALASTGERFSRQDWGFESQSWLVAAARGHLVAEADPDAYDERYKRWALEDLPIIPEPPRYVARNRDAAGLLRTLATLAARDDVTGLVNACDAGREGELIFALIYEFCAVGKPVERAWFSSMTEEAIVDAFARLRPSRDLGPLEAAARCRSQADWLVGINATRAATVRLAGRELVSLGRVQTPTLALVARRDAEIEAFVPQTFYTVKGTFQTEAGQFTATWFPPASPVPADSSAAPTGRLATLEQAEEIVARCDGVDGTVASVESKEVRSRPPKLFDLTSLQQEANRRYGFSAARTLQAAQELYETHKLATYPRTDSTYITSDMVDTIPEVLAQVAVLHPALASVCAALTATTPPPWKALVNDAKVTDHHAIIPTNAPGDLTTLSEDCRRVLDLITRRFVAAQMTAAVSERTTVVVEVGTAEHDRFRVSGLVELDPGWRAVYPGPGIGTVPAVEDADSEDEDDEQALPPVVEGQAAENLEVVTCEGKTKPPSFFNEASLLGAMAAAGRLVDDEELAEAMKDSGLGTPATRAAIIERLIKVGYLERRGRQLRATVKGRSVVDLLGDHVLASPAMTGEWERRLRLIERAVPGSEPSLRDEFLTDAKEFTRSVVGDLVGLDPARFQTAAVLGPCPIADCGGQVIERRKSWSCDSWKSKEDPGCGFAIWKEQAGRRVSHAQALKILAAAPSTVAPRAERVELSPCPTPGCGGMILERVKSWSCDSWKSKEQPGCGFVIWRTSRDGIELSRDDALALVATGQSHARPPAEILAPCPMPRCKGSIVEKEKSFSCNSWSPTRKGCGLVVWKTDREGNEVATRDMLDQLLPAAAQAALERKAAPTRGRKATQRRA